MNKPTTAITDAMIDCFSAASNIRLAFNNHRAQVAAGLDAVLAMQSATPSTPELGELVERPHVFTGRVVNGTAICKFCSATPLEAAYALGPTCPQHADPTISSLQKEIDTKTEALIEARQFIRDNFSFGAADSRTNAGKCVDIIDAALSSKGEQA
jgi:hypothetical protein